MGHMASLRIVAVTVLLVTGMLGSVPRAAGAIDAPDPIMMVAVGDMAPCSGGNPERVGALLDVLPGEILGLGDYAYPNGTAAEFRDCFDPHFGRNKQRFLPAVGNHEYGSPGARPYADYFGAAAGDPATFYYEQRRGNWQIIVLNSNCGQVGGCGPGSAQYRWLETTLASAPPASCRIVTMHHPRWSSYSTYGTQSYLEPMLSLVEAAGTDLVLTGHSHHYERFAPQTASGVRSDRGFVQITVGTGGVALRQPDIVAENSLVRRKAHGALSLTLRESSYDLSFIGADGDVLDRSSGPCLDAGTDDLAVQPDQAALVRLYEAVFLRAPDRAGLEYWTSIQRGGTLLGQIAGFFADSDEFRNRYAALDDPGFIDLLYRNTLGRSSDVEGRAYWLAEMRRGVPRGAIVIAFSEAPEFVSKHPF